MRVSLAVVLLVVSVLFPVGSISAQNPLASDGVLAVVNDEVVTRFDILRSLRLSGVDLSALKESEQKLQVTNALHRKVVEILQRQAATEAGITVSEEEHINRRSAIIAQFEGEDNFLAYLDRTGVTEEEWTRDFRATTEAAAWKSVVAGVGGAKSLEVRPLYDVSVTPREMREFYRRNLDADFKVKNEAQLRVIQVYFRRGTPQDRSAKKQLMMQILAKLKTRASFDVLAERYNENPQSKDKKGDLGWVAKGSDSIREKIETAVFADGVTAGKVLGPIETVNSFWLVKVEDRHLPRTRSFGEVQSQIKRLLRSQKHRDVTRRLVLQLVNDSFIYPRSLKPTLKVSLRGL